MACQNYFIHFEPGQSLGGKKTGYPQEKPPTTLAYLTCEARTQVGEMTSDLQR